MCLLSRSRSSISRSLPASFLSITVFGFDVKTFHNKYHSSPTMIQKATMAQKIDLLVKHCPDCKPTHRLIVQATVNEQSYEFKPGKLLDKLKDFFTDKHGGVSDWNTQSKLSHELRGKLFSLPWFEQWLKTLVNKRKIAAEEPSLQDQFRMLVLNCVEKAPVKGDVIICERIDSCLDYKLHPHSVLEKFSPNFFSEDGDAALPEDHPLYIPPYLKEAFFRLSWAHSWIEKGKKRREVSKMRKVVTKAMKLEVLLNLYRTRKPKWKECVNIVYDNSGSIFNFYVGTFLDDLVENWSPSSRRSGPNTNNDGDENQEEEEGEEEETRARPSVVLDEAQKMAIESLPWFRAWHHGIIEGRQMRPLKRALLGDDEDENEEGESACETDVENESTQSEYKRPRIVD